MLTFGEGFATLSYAGGLQPVHRHRHRNNTDTDTDTDKDTDPPPHTHIYHPPERSPHASVSKERQMRSVVGVPCTAIHSTALHTDHAVHVADMPARIDRDDDGERSTVHSGVEPYSEYHTLPHLTSPAPTLTPSGPRMT